MPDVFEIAEVFVAEATAAFPGEIALIAYYGSHAKGTASDTSDLDLFYIPDGGDPVAPLASVVVGGLPYDFWPVSWQMAEEIADARSRRPWAVAASLIADARILYARSEKDRSRFGGLQQRVAALTEPEARPAMVRKALDAFPGAVAALGQMRLSVQEDDVPGSAWAGRSVIEASLNCLALVNQTYFSKGWGGNFAEAAALEQRPAHLMTLIERILVPPGHSDIVAAAEELVAGVRSILRQAQIESAVPVAAADVFRDFYYYIHEYVSKAEAACGRGDVLAAGYAAAMLEEQVARLLHLADAGYAPTQFNLIGEYCAAYRAAGLPDLHGLAAAGDLPALQAAARECDARMREWLTRHGIDLREFADARELRGHLRRRYDVTDSL